MWGETLVEGKGLGVTHEPLRADCVHMSDAATITTRAPVRPFRSKRLLALVGDDRLVEQIQRGNEAAFEVAFERHGAGILAFCRHMVGSHEEAEDVVQHTFAAAFKDLQRDGERSIALKAWLYAIARNRCVSVLRARREQAAELEELPTDGLSEQVERRAELRELLADVGQLPEDQRAALLLAEAAGLSHAEVAQVLGCETAGVKGLVFRARSGLIERRLARETPCDEIREQLATLRGGALRRNELRHHLRSCPGCSAYRAELRHQRKLLAVALPVTPSFGLKGSVLAAAGVGGRRRAGLGRRGQGGAGGRARRWEHRRRGDRHRAGGSGARSCGARRRARRRRKGILERRGRYEGRPRRADQLRAQPRAARRRAPLGALARQGGRRLERPAGRGTRLGRRPKPRTPEAAGRAAHPFPRKATRAEGAARARDRAGARGPGQAGPAAPDGPGAERPGGAARAGGARRARGGAGAAPGLVRPGAAEAAEVARG